MPYVKTNWTERVRQFANRFLLTPTGTTNEYDIARVEGTVSATGTPLSITNLGKLEQGVFDAYYQSGATFLENVTATLTGDPLAQVDETVGGVLRRRTALAYTDGVLTSVNTKIYQADGTTVELEYTDTLNYTDGTLTSVTRTVI